MHTHRDIHSGTHRDIKVTYTLAHTGRHKHVNILL